MIKLQGKKVVNRRAHAMTGICGQLNCKAELQTARGLLLCSCDGAQNALWGRKWDLCLIYWPCQLVQVAVPLV